MIYEIVIRYITNAIGAKLKSANIIVTSIISYGLCFFHCVMYRMLSYNESFDVILLGLLGYSRITIFMNGEQLLGLMKNRSTKIEFFVGILLIIAVFTVYWFFRKKLNDANIESLTDEEKTHYVELKKKLGDLKFGIVTGLSAIVIGSLALINKIIPGFFITLVINYYASIHL